jgi:molybdopterin-containing oxidoreductase family membrane subunit
MTETPILVEDSPYLPKVLVREPLMIGDPGDAELTDKLLEPLWKTRIGLLLFVTGGGAAVFFLALIYTFITGIGTWGNNIPVAWAYAITNFVWWIGIGHAGTFISAFLLVLEQRWRTAINRLAEAMTLFALMNAGLFPVAHLGRAWFSYWLVPYPAMMMVWPNFRSALCWDIVAITSYFSVSLMFWYLGLVPDLAAARDRAPSRLARRIYGVLALGWRGSARHWRHYRLTYLVIAGLATPLVVSVHSIVSMDFSSSKVSGWHSTIFPPYFVAGAIFSGFAMVLTLMIPTRRAFRLQNVITERHLDCMAKITLLTGSIVAYSYLVEHFVAWYSGDPFDISQLNATRPRGPYAPLFWLQIACNVVVPQLLWIPKLRKHDGALFIISILINVGMWVERFVIIAVSLSRDFLPSSWYAYAPSFIDWMLLLGSLSFFTFMYLLFIRYLPFIPISELKEMRHELKEHAP